MFLFFVNHYALIPIFLEFRSSDLYYISKCWNDGPDNDSSQKNGPSIASVRGLPNMWFFTILLLNRQKKIQVLSIKLIRKGVKSYDLMP